MCGSRLDLLKITSKEANSVVNFFGSNNLVNNAEKAAVLYNSRGKGESITVDDIGGEKIQSTHTEKLLGIHINSNLWSSKKELDYYPESNKESQ